MTDAPVARLSRLSDAERDVFESVEVEGLRAVVLSNYSSRSPTEIRTLLSRARSKLGGPEAAARVADARRNQSLNQALGQAEPAQSQSSTDVIWGES